MIERTYIPYHMHTEYSLLDSCTKPQEYIDLAVRDGAKAISFSEHGKILNWTEKYAACKKAGIRYIHSVEIYMTESLDEKVRDNYHTVLMARNMDGLRELNNIISLSCNKDHFYYTNRISFDEFIGLSENIIATSACLASPLNRLPEDHPRYMELVDRYDFLEVQPHNHPDQIAYNKRLSKISKRTGKPLIAGTDTHSSSKYKAECRHILLKAKHKTYGDEDAFDLSYKTYDELVECFKNQGALSEDEYLTAIENTNLLYDMTEDIELDLKIKYPILYGTREKDKEVFEKTVEDMFRDKLDKGIIPKEQEQGFREAIDEEMRVFNKLNMSGFMLSMSELVRWCKSQNMAIGTARGSVGGSRIAYITDIIDLNPETWHTVFSRFANEDREEIGDIDIDCIESDRPMIFQYITERFGTDKTARVASFGTLKERNTIAEIGRALSLIWADEHDTEDSEKNPYSLPRIAEIKKEYEENPEKAKENHPELFYFFDGLLSTKISQSVHPAGMVISPITLPDNFGVFDKDDDICLMLDMDNIHDYTGLAKYDFLVLKTLQVIRDTCNYIGIPYPKTHEMNWDDEAVWDSMTKSSTAIFQMESKYSHDCLKKFKPKSIFDMALVTAAVRPSGASYRDDLLARRVHKNPSEVIDKMLEKNYGFLVFQEDTIRFLQEVCVLSGSNADNIRRAIGRKQKDRLDAAMPSILEGYCAKSSQPREIAEREAKEFLQIIEDSASYQFGYNHSIAYCLLGYLCAYYRYYYPLEFLTSFLNNAANDDDVKTGTIYALSRGFKVTMPKWGVSKKEYFYNAQKGIISKGLSSVKYIGDKVAEQLFEVANSKEYEYFIDVLIDLCEKTSIDTRQIGTLIKIDFFSDFGNQRELLAISKLFFETFNQGSVKKINKDKVAGSYLEPIIQKYSIGVTKSGGIAKAYTILDAHSLMIEAEEKVKSLNLNDLSDTLKVRNFADVMGYAGYVSGKEEDRRKLYVTDIYPLKRNSDGALFGYSIKTKSIGSGKESRFTVFNSVFNKKPISKDWIIYCKSYKQDRGYFVLTDYSIVN